MRLHIHSAKQLVAVCGNGERFLRKSEFSKFLVLNQEETGISKEGVSVVVDENGLIADLGWTSEVKINTQLLISVWATTSDYYCNVVCCIDHVL